MKHRWDKIAHEMLVFLRRHFPHEHKIPAVLEDILEDRGEWLYERDPTATRDSETSQLQDDLGNFHAGPEVDVYAMKVEEFSRLHARDHASDTRPL